MNPHTRTTPQLIKYTSRSIDGMRRSAPPPRASRPIVRRMQSTVTRPAIAQQLTRPRPPMPSTPAATPPHRRTGRRIPSSLQLPLIIIGAMVVGVLIQSPLVGQLLVIIYGIVAFICRIPSRVTFMLAITALIAAALLMVMKHNTVLAQGYASYTFLLLVAGVIALSREIRKEGGRIYTSRKNVM